MGNFWQEASRALDAHRRLIDRPRQHRELNTKTIPAAPAGQGNNAVPDYLELNHPLGYGVISVYAITNPTEKSITCPF